MSILFALILIPVALGLIALIVMPLLWGVRIVLQATIWIAGVIAELNYRRVARRYNRAAAAAMYPRTEVTE